MSCTCASCQPRMDDTAVKASAAAAAAALAIAIANIPRDEVRCDSFGCEKLNATVQCPDCKAAYYCCDECRMDHAVDHETYCEFIQSKEWNVVRQGTLNTEMGATITIPTCVKQPHDEMDAFSAFVMSPSRSAATECSICLDDPNQKTGPVVTLEACQHVFCLACLVQWQRQSTTYEIRDPEALAERVEESPAYMPQMGDFKKKSLICPSCRSHSEHPEDYLCLKAAEGVFKAKHPGCPADLRANLLNESFMITAALLQVKDAELHPMYIMAEVLVDMNRAQDAIDTTRKLISMDQERHKKYMPATHSAVDPNMAWIVEANHDFYGQATSDASLSALYRAASASAAATAATLKLVQQHQREAEAEAAAAAAAAAEAANGNGDANNANADGTSAETAINLAAVDTGNAPAPAAATVAAAGSGNGTAGNGAAAAATGNTAAGNGNGTTGNTPTTATSTRALTAEMLKNRPPMLYGDRRNRIYQSMYQVQGEAFAQKQKWYDSIRVYKQYTVAMAPEIAQLDTGDEEQRQAFRKSHAGSVLAHVYKGMASSYIEMYDFDKSIDAANHAIDIDRSVPGVHQLKARALLAKARGDRKAPDPTPTGQSASVAAQASGSSSPPSQANGTGVAAAADPSTDKDESEQKVAARPFTRAAKAAAEKLALEQKVAAATATVTMRRSKRLKTAHVPNVAESPASASASAPKTGQKTGQKPDPPGENLSEKASAGTAAAVRMPLSPQEIDALQKEALLAVTLGVLYESPWDPKQQSSNLEMYHKLHSQFEDRKRAPIAKRPALPL